MDQGAPPAGRRCGVRPGDRAPVQCGLLLGFPRAQRLHQHKQKSLGQRPLLSSVVFHRITTLPLEGPALHSLWMQSDLCAPSGTLAMGVPEGGRLQNTDPEPEGRLPVKRKSHGAWVLLTDSTNAAGRFH